MHYFITAVMLYFSLFSFSACDDSDDDETPSGYSVTLEAQLKKDENGQLPFMTPGATPVRLDPWDVIGKPYYIALFKAGFSQGVDDPVHFTWGTINEEMTVKWTSKADLEDGPYDIVLVIYRVTNVPDEAIGKASSIAAVNGDLATFTISEENLLEGDPPLTAGTLRVNVNGENASTYAENRWADNLQDTEAGTRAFTDTILFVP